VTDRYMNVYDVNVRSEVGHANKYFDAPCPWKVRETAYNPVNVNTDISG
jgi:hypothetical protein